MKQSPFTVAKIAAKRILKHLNSNAFEKMLAEKFLKLNKASDFDIKNVMWTWRDVKSYGPKKSLVGENFGKLTVVGMQKRRAKDRQIVYTCLCDCGKTYLVAAKYLRNGKSTHCGCSRKKSKK